MKQVAVAAGVIKNTKGEVLIAKRADDQHQGGLWEFPGGKIEPNESAQQALARELNEELGIEVSASHPLIRIHHQYTDKSVLLDVWVVTHFTGEARGLEGQPIQWVAPAKLTEFDFPAANAPIVAAAQLPDRIAILDDLDDTEALERTAQMALEQGFPWIILRAPDNSEAQLRRAISHVQPLADFANAKLVLNCSIPLANKLKADALLLTASHLVGMGSRAEFNGAWLGAACHNAGELQLAQDKGLDFASLSPLVVNYETDSPFKEAATDTTDECQAVIGWTGFQSMVEPARIPVYARGGLSTQDIEQAQTLGAQGIMQSVSGSRVEENSSAPLRGRRG